MSDPVLPTPEQLQRRLQELLRTTFAAPGNSPENPPTPTEPADKVPPAIQDFHLTPREVKAHLDRFVIRQDEAKKVLGIAVCDHYNNARVMASREAGAPPLEYAKQNVLIAGPTGVGKTYLVKHVADLIGVPFVKADATKFSETGYVGGDVDDLVRELVQKADGNLALAQYGIIYIDEIDKIATSREVTGRDVSGRGVQTTLLKLMEETDVALRGGNDLQSQVQAALEFQKRGKVNRESINTRHILFIVSGAFDKLTDVVSRRLKKTGIGFGADPAAATTLPAELLRLAGTSDFVDYGLEPEFIGRLPVRVVCESLAEGDLFEILKQSEGSLIRQYERAFAAYGIEAVFSDEALRHIASLAVRENTGARGLMTTCEGLLREFKYRLPGSPVRTLEVTPAVLENPEAAIERLLQAGAENARQAQSLVITQFAERFGEQHGYRFRFSPEAVEAILAKSVEKNISARDLCEGLFKDYQFGLGLIHRNSGQTDFEIPAEAVESPDRVLSQWVVASHRTQDEHDENS
ncbi:MAG: ATP-dependent protease [Spartobacteria bacterium AMD-G5]|nr:MAG: ATP-dependent protease [Spartobacteria bacterium AMD-G5]